MRLPLGAGSIGVFHRAAIGPRDGLGHRLAGGDLVQRRADVILRAGDFPGLRRRLAVLGLNAPLPSYVAFTPPLAISPAASMSSGPTRSEAAAREQALASDPAGIVRSEEGNDGRDVLLVGRRGQAAFAPRQPFRNRNL